MRLSIAFALIPHALAQMPTSPAAIGSGMQLYLGACSGCHGATGEGSQGPSLLSVRVTRLADDTLFNTIKNGLPSTSMPDSALPGEKVWQIAAFVRSLTAPAISANPPGDPARGRAIFFGEGKCSACHMIMGEGGYPGPDLSNIGAGRTLHQLHESIVKPSERVDPAYRPVTATLKSGSVVTGVARNYDNYTAQILDNTGRLHLLQRASLAQFDIKDGSIMPAVTNPDTVMHLIAFLARQATRPYEGASR